MIEYLVQLLGALVGAVAFVLFMAFMGAIFLVCLVLPCLYLLWRWLSR